MTIKSQANANMVLQSNQSEQEIIKQFNELELLAIEKFNNSQGDLVGYNCDKCKNKGMMFVYDFVNGRIHSKVKECECKIKRRSIKRLEQSGLKDLINQYKFSTYKAESDWQKLILTKAQSFLKNNARCFFIGGQVGSGKTHICTAICLHLLKQALDTKYMVWRDEIMNIKLNMFDEYREKLEELKKTKVLYIDDFFKMRKGEEPTTSDINIAFEIINHRYINKDLITIISSEKTLDELLDIDESIGSRLYQMAGEYVINIQKEQGKNYRLKNTAKL